MKKVHSVSLVDKDQTSYFVGIMSGTSLDGVDVVLASIPSKEQFSLIGAETYPTPEPLKADLLNLAQTRQDNELERYADLDVQMGHLFANCCLKLLKQLAISPEQVKAIGNHGQTLRHYPKATFPTTLQIGDPNIIAQLTGITTIADFRRRDMAAGGQGAPLVPPFHQAIFTDVSRNRIILNIGGIANITTLAAHNSTILGYDTGPGDGLMDDWCLRHFDCPFDADGRLAAQGKPDPELLSHLLADPYFAQSAPKSTGREYFSYHWLSQKLNGAFTNLNDKDILATLLELTCCSIINEVQSQPFLTDEILVCGGGAKNTQLMQRLSIHADGITVQSTEQYGLHPDWVEASAFAWLAHQTLNGLTGNLPSVTGAHQEVILGAIWPV